MKTDPSELLALFIVVTTFLIILYQFFKNKCAYPLATFLLKKGKVKQAMWLRNFSLKNKNKNCH